MANKNGFMIFYAGDQFLFRLGAEFFLPTEGSDRRCVTLTNCHDNHFFSFAVKKERKKSDDGRDCDRICAAVQMIGTKSEANNFSYRYKRSNKYFFEIFE